MNQGSAIGMLIAIAAGAACGSRGVAAPDSGTNSDGSDGEEDAGPTDGGDGGSDGRFDAGDPIDASTDIHCWHDVEACPPEARYCCEPHDPGADEGRCFRTPPLTPVDYWHCQENPPEGTTLEIDCLGQNGWPDPDLCPGEFPYCCGYMCADHPVVGANCRG